MSDDSALILQLSADIRGLERQMARARGVVNDSAGAMEARAEKMAGQFGQAFGRISLAAGVAFGAIVALSVKAASDAAETQNAFEVAFGRQTKAAEDFARKYSSSVGRAFVEVQDHMAQTQLVLTGIGLAGDQALKLTEALTSRSVDIGSLFNVSDADAFRAVMSGISGEAEPLKRFGIVVNETAVKAELLRLGFKGNAEQASEAAKAVARANIILRESAKAAGDALRTQGGLANSTKAMEAKFHDAAVVLGQQFLPLATKLVGWASDALTAFNKLDGGVQLAGLGLLGLVAASGPIAATIGGLANLIKWANGARVALAGVAGANALAGASGAAGVGGGAAAGVMSRLGLPGMAAAVAAYVGVGVNDSARAFNTLHDLPKATDADLAWVVGYLHSHGGVDAKGNLDADANWKRSGPAVEAEITRRAGALATSLTAAGDAATAMAGQFALTADQQKGTGGKGGGGRGGRGRSRSGGSGLNTANAYLPDMQEAGPEVRVTPHEMSDWNNFGRIGSLPTRDDTELKGAPYFSDIWHGQLLSPDAADELRSAMTSNIRGALEAAIHGGWSGLASYMASMLEQRLLDSLSNSLGDLIFGNKNSGGLFGAIGHIFGFADGTPSAPGGLSWVGERGPELMNVPRGAQIFPHGSMTSAMTSVGSMRGGGGSGVVNLTVNVHAEGAAMISQIHGMVIAGATEVLGAATPHLIKASSAQAQNDIAWREYRTLR